MREIVDYVVEEALHAGMKELFFTSFKVSPRLHHLRAISFTDFMVQAASYVNTRYRDKGFTPDNPKSAIMWIKKR